ncbi:MAG: serine hydrolase [Clostridia bacterium]|nr:serine hydrolase [Clostridia bacterium]
MNIKQKAAILVYFILTALLFGGVMMLGSHYIGENTADVPTVSPAEETDDVLTESEQESAAADTDDTDCTESKIIVSEETEPITETQQELSVEITDPDVEELPAETEHDPIQKLMLLLEKNAPLRWADAETLEESAEPEEEAETEHESEEEQTLPSMETNPDPDAASETASEDTSEPESEPEQEIEPAGEEPQYVKVYPKLAYYYKDLTTGTVVSYNADEILYSASLIKAPFIYAVLEEIDAFEKSKLPPEETTDETDAADEEIPETEASPADTDSSPETEAAEEIPAESEIEETKAEIVYLPGEEKYNLDEIWTFDPETMMEAGSGEIQYMPAGTQMTWRELFEYAILYSDNIAFAQIRERFGYASFYKKVAELKISGVPTGFMNLSAQDCGIFLEEMYTYFETDSEYARLMRDCMARSKHVVMIAVNYPTGTAVHKYGWDLGAYHDMAIIYDEHPYLLVIMTDYEDGGKTANGFIAEVVALTKEIHASLHPDEPEDAKTSETSETSEKSETSADK